MKSVKTSGSVSTDYASSEMSDRFLGNRMCINAITDVGTAVDQYGRLVGLNSVNTQNNPGCFSANLAIERENQGVRQFYLSALAPDAAAAIGETIPENIPHWSYTTSEDTLGVMRDRNITEPRTVKYSDDDVKNYGDLLSMSCRATKKNQDRQTICPSNM